MCKITIHKSIKPFFYSQFFLVSPNPQFSVPYKEGKQKLAYKSAQIEKAQAQTQS